MQVERNTSGSRPKELFEDVIEDLEGEYEKASVSVAWGPAWRAGAVATCSTHWA